jgi:hypothetical protein
MVSFRFELTMMRQWRAGSREAQTARQIQRIAMPNVDNDDGACNGEVQVCEQFAL